MAGRSIHLKMIVPRRDDGEQLRRCLWLTHSEINQAVAALEQILLLCRGSGYVVGGVPIAAQEVQEAAVCFAREVQSRNGKPNAGSDEEVLSVLRSLYEALVPSVLLDGNGEPRDGKSQDAGGFAGPLMDGASAGFQNIFDKILDPLPDWVQGMAARTSDWETQSALWLETAAAQSLLRATGSPMTWVRRLRAKKPWQEAFVLDQQKKRKEISGVPTLIRRARHDLALLPICRPPIASRMQRNRGALTPWDRLALKLAVAHLLSWESWNHRAAREHHQQRAKVDALRVQLEGMPEHVASLRRYEEERHAELRRVALADDERPYRIGSRAIRGLPELRKAWLGEEGATESSRLDALRQLQRKLGGRFGDPYLFHWLAAAGREEIWRNANTLPIHAKLNAAERRLERKKDYAAYTPADAREHPRWVNFEAPGGSNLRNFKLSADQNSRVTLTIKLLQERENSLAEKDFRVHLAPSRQLQAPRLDGKGKATRLFFRSAYQAFSANLAGSDILFDRRHFENRTRDELAAGDVGCVWFKLVVNLDSQAPPEWLDGRGAVRTPKIVHHFNSGLATKSRHSDALAPGLRVLSVDLGLRTFAACSVFELVKGEPGDRLAFLADADLDLWARHERSFLLTMPGERVDAATEDARARAYDELGALNRDLERLKRLLRLSVQETVDNRRTGLEELQASLSDEQLRGGESVVPHGLVADLAAAADSAPAAWQEALLAPIRYAEQQLAERVRIWRKRTRRRAMSASERKQQRGYFGGKSIWAIEYLENVRRFLLRWALRGRQYAQINRADRERRGTIARALLDHINALKRDRLKVGADLIVQAARGFVPDLDGGGWRRAHDSCRVILFEDLSRYNFRSDRPRRENKQLMRWCHREIIREATTQAEIYGITVENTGAGFSSRFHARTHAPGCRTHLLTSKDLASASRRLHLERAAEALGIRIEQLAPGMRVPWEGGEEFAALGPGERPIVTHADLNAAQNLQRRFWTRHADAYRINAARVIEAGSEAWYVVDKGTRTRGAVAGLCGHDGYAKLISAQDGDGYCLEGVPRGRWRRATGNQATENAEEFDDDPTDEEQTMELQSDRATFFRDPSGLVLPHDRWFKSGEFWARVQARVSQAIKRAMAADRNPF